MGRCGSRIIDNAVREDGARDELVAMRSELLAPRLRAARLFLVIERSHHWVFEGCASVGEFGERYGYSAREARLLVAAALALELRPDLESRLLAGTLTMESVAELGRIYRDPGLIREGDDWIRWAEEWSARRLSFEVRKRIMETREMEPTSTLMVVCTGSTREKYDRARTIASRKKRKFLDGNGTIEALSDHYLDSFDPQRKNPGKRRMPETKGHPGRTIPAEVKRAVRDRDGEECDYPGCDNHIFLDFAHDEPHASGGSREADNLAPRCTIHHTLSDEGFIEKVADGQEVYWIVHTMKTPQPRPLGGAGKIRPAGTDPP